MAVVDFVMQLSGLDSNYKGFHKQMGMLVGSFSHPVFLYIQLLYECNFLQILLVLCQTFYHNFFFPLLVLLLNILVFLSIYLYTSGV